MAWQPTQAGTSTLQAFAWVGLTVFTFSCGLYTPLPSKNTNSPSPSPAEHFDPGPFDTYVGRHADCGDRGSRNNIVRRMYRQEAPIVIPGSQDLCTIAYGSGVTPSLEIQHDWEPAIVGFELTESDADLYIADAIAVGDDIYLAAFPGNDAIGFRVVQLNHKNNRIDAYTVARYNGGSWNNIEQVQSSTVIVDPATFIQHVTDAVYLLHPDALPNRLVDSHEAILALDYAYGRIWLLYADRIDGYTLDGSPSASYELPWTFTQTPDLRDMLIAIEVDVFVLALKTGVYYFDAVGPQYQLEYTQSAATFPPTIVDGYWAVASTVSGRTELAHYDLKHGNYSHTVRIQTEPGINFPLAFDADGSEDPAAYFALGNSSLSVAATTDEYD